MKIFYCIIICSAWLLHTSCTKDQIEAYSTSNYIYLAQDTSTTTEYSFAFNPGVDKDTVPIVVKLIGTISDQDRIFGLKLDAANSTALGSDYTLPQQIVLRAGRTSDTIPLVLHKSARMATEKYTIRLVLENNDNFMIGPVKNSYIKIIFSDMIAKPAWWNSVVTTNFLSQYSDTKYRLFIEATGIADMSALSETEQRAYAVIFRDFLARGREAGAVYVDENGMINVSPNLN